MYLWGKKMAETVRFELTVRFDPYDALARRWFKPLTHVSRGLIVNQF